MLTPSHPSLRCAILLQSRLQGSHCAVAGRLEKSFAAVSCLPETRFPLMIQVCSQKFGPRIRSKLRAPLAIAALFALLFQSCTI